MEPKERGASAHPAKRCFAFRDHRPLVPTNHRSRSRFLARFVNICLHAMHRYWERKANARNANESSSSRKMLRRRSSRSIRLAIPSHAPSAINSLKEKRRCKDGRGSAIDVARSFPSNCIETRSGGCSKKTNRSTEAWDRYTHARDGHSCDRIQSGRSDTHSSRSTKKGGFECASAKFPERSLVLAASPEAGWTDLGDLGGLPMAYAPPTQRAVRRGSLPSGRDRVVYILPGIFFLIVSVLAILASLIQGVIYSLAIAVATEKNPEVIPYIVGYLVGSVLVLSLGILEFAAGIALIRQRGLGLAKAASIVCCIPCTCFFFALPIGIWGCILLFSQKATRDFK